MKTPIIQFEDAKPEQMEELRKFAATLTPPHYIHPHEEKYRIVIVKSNGVWVGYAIIVNTPIVFSAWNKDRCTAALIWEAMKAFVGWSKLQYGDGYTTVPFDTRTFPEKIMNKLGFYRLKVELYRIDE